MKGKKRARHESPAATTESSLSPLPVETSTIKKPKRAEVKPCPVCEEPIPIRLLPIHLDLELKRVEDIVKAVGSPEVLQDADDQEEGPSSRNRRSAVKARKSLSQMNPRTIDPTDTLLTTSRMITSIQAHRKKRLGKFREMAREEEEGACSWLNGSGSNEGRDGTVCPVCGVFVRGDRDVIEAHVDSCLAHANRRLEEEQREINAEENIDIGDDRDLRYRVTDGANLNGLGFHIRDSTHQDVDDEIDIDGDDEAVFGSAQFTEGDILVPTNTENGDVRIDADSDDESGTDLHKTLRDLMSQGKVVRRSSPRDGVEAVKAKMEEVMGVGDVDKMDLMVNSARKHVSKNPGVLIEALENKIKQLESMRVSSSTSLLCRICLDPYTEATVSTGCWHTCCRECWLRCLGSTNLCPICKRITAAGDLRRIYL